MGQTAYPDFNQFEIVQVGVTSISAAAATNTWVTVPHNLGYIPVSIAYLNNINLGAVFSHGNIQLPCYINATTTGGNVVFQTYLFCGVDVSAFYPVMLNAGATPTGTFPVKYFLLRERSS